MVEFSVHRMEGSRVDPRSGQAGRAAFRTKERPAAEHSHATGAGARRLLCSADLSRSNSSHRGQTGGDLELDRPRRWPGCTACPARAVGLARKAITLEYSRIARTRQREQLIRLSRAGTRAAPWVRRRVVVDDFFRRWIQLPRGPTRSG